MQVSHTLAIIGNPNSGKTTLFNELTGARQRTGNWPGVTVERKEGVFDYQNERFLLVDLPGTYSLDSESPSLDERIAREFIVSHKADVVINIIDASNLERSLYLTAQLIEMAIPMVVVLNMIDIASSHGMTIDADQLSRRLGCPVVVISATRKQGLDELRAQLQEATRHLTLPTVQVPYPQPVESAIASLEPLLRHHVSQAQLRWQALQLLLQHADAEEPVFAEASALAEQYREQIAAQTNADIDQAVSQARYDFAAELASHVATLPEITPRRFSDRVDDVVLSRWLGIPVFLLVMYLMFTLTINIGGAFVDFFDQAVGAVLVQGLGAWLDGMGVPAWLRVLLADGIGGGIEVVATFIPIIGFLYLCLSFLEDSGYMARAAFVMDRLMRKIGLPGKAFVPLIVGFGCNVPAIMSTRTLDVERERLMSIMMAPFMSCGARLSVYALFAAAFFPVGGQNVVFVLYLVGILAAVLTGFVLKKTLLQGEAGAFLMELPSYRLPSFKSMLLLTWSRLKGFVKDAGKFIVVMVVLINVLNSLGTDGSFGNEDSEKSVLSELGMTLTPAFSPIGIREDNWPATVGLFTGLLAKEVVVGALDAMYSQLDRPPESVREQADEAFRLGPALAAAVATIPANLKDALENLTDPLGLGVLKTSSVQGAAREQGVSLNTFGAMQHRFDGKIGAFSYMLFVLLYFPCVAATAAIRREAGWSWTLFAIGWTTSLAFMMATLFYQLATFSRHPTASLLWVLGIAITLGGVYLFLREMGRRYPPVKKPFPVPVVVERKTS